jgi:predicted DNA-binding protein (MmcQ/YjbR family)
MRSDEIRKFCLSLSEVTEKLQWGDALCFKVVGKMFAVLGLDNPRLSFKCTPEVFDELIERENIRPAPYVARYKWVMLDRLDALGNDELRELIRQSHELVRTKAPKPKKAVVSRKRAQAKSSRNRKRTISN